MNIYLKLAWDSIQKNKKLYIPFIISCTAMVTMFYIVTSIQYSEAITYLPGSETIAEMLNLGGWVITVFSAIFLFYTNTFLLKQRKKEFGLYNILGMGKRNLIILQFFEFLIIAVLSLVIGLFLGIVFSKLAELILFNILQTEVIYDFNISLEALEWTIGIYSSIFLILFLNAAFQLRLSSTISLLKSQNTGEKPPKGNFILALLGLLLLGGAYYISLTIEDPVTSLLYFFVAVIMVIIGTYLLMISGSVYFCRLLQRHEKFYYKTNHFISLSSMTYRMKRNGAGLASICILATMVLVALSTTASLYFGYYDVLYSRYPRQIDTSFITESVEALRDENIDGIDSLVDQSIYDFGAQITDVRNYRSAAFAAYLDGNKININAVKNLSESDPSGLRFVHIIPLSDYNELIGSDIVLEEDEVLIDPHGMEYDYDTISFENGRNYIVKDIVDNIDAAGELSLQIVSGMFVVVPDLESSVQGLDTIVTEDSYSPLVYSYTLDFDTDLSPEDQVTFDQVLYEKLEASDLEGNYGIESFNTISREFKRTDSLSLYSSLFFLGIILSIVFLVGAVLIIYYKQISEGYEDQSRFAIMQKLGLTKKEIRKSINSQLLLVFFLPIILAAVHLLFAFPIINNILVMFQLNNVTLFAITTIGCVILFSLFYSVIYALTSNAYYKIVSDAKEK